MKEGCKFMGVVLSSRSASGDVRQGKEGGEEEREEPITLLLASNEECMVDVMSMALCYLVVQGLGGDAAGGVYRRDGDRGGDGANGFVEERIVEEEERMVESQPAPPGESAPGSDAPDPPTTTARLNLDTTCPSVLSPCATIRPSVGVEECSPRVEGEVIPLDDDEAKAEIAEEDEPAEVKDGRPVEGGRDEDETAAREHQIDVASNPADTSSAPVDKLTPTVVDEITTATTTEHHSTTLPRFEGEDEEGYTPVHRLMWKLHDDYEVRVIRPVKPLVEGEDEEVDVVVLDGEAGDEKAGGQVYLNGIFAPPQPNTAKFSNLKQVSKLGQPDFQSSEPRPSQPGPEVPREAVPRNAEPQSQPLTNPIPQAQFLNQDSQPRPPHPDPQFHSSYRVRVYFARLPRLFV